MDANLKAKWVEALRSGDFIQVQNEIGLGNTLCCIGVCGKVAGIHENSNDWGSYNVSRLIGLTPDQRDLLFNMNDQEKKPFPEIADYIESNL